MLILPLLVAAKLLSQYTAITAVFYRLCWLVAGVVWLSFRASLILNQELPVANESQPVVVTGTVTSLPEITTKYTQYHFNIDSMQTEQGDSVYFNARVRLRWYGQAPEIAAGEKWRLKVKMKRPHGFQNPGGFDYEAWLFRQRLRATGYVLDSEVNTKLEPPGMRFILSGWRGDIVDSVRKALPENQVRGVVNALAVGDRAEITDDMWQVFRNTGTSHLVAISGLHIGLVSGLMMLVSSLAWRWWGRPVLFIPAPKFAAAAGLTAGFIYAALAGFSIPTQRALLMLIVVVMAILWQRRLRPFHVLAWSLLLVLSFDPLSIMSQGFWLSFLAVAIIVFALFAPGKRLQNSPGSANVFEKGISKLATTGWAWGKLQIIICIGLAPLLLLFYQHVSFVAPLANLLAIPVVGFIAVPLILLGVLFDTIGIVPVGHGLFNLVNGILEWLWYCLSWLSRLDALNFSGTQPNVWLLGAGLIGAALLFAPRGAPARWLGLVWMLPLFIAPSAALERGTVRMTILDVGQGLAVVVQTQSHVLLFDTGPRYSERFDAGSAVVVPYLRHQRIRHIDTLVLSHADNDHTGGLQGIAESIPINRIMAGMPQENANITECRGGDKWNWDGVNFEVLWPVEDKHLDENNRSCVLKITTISGILLLTGDIEAEAEQRLVQKYGTALESDVLLLPHHGSNTSSTPAFLEAVQPNTAIVSSGYRNRFQHPHLAVIERLNKREVQWRDTQASGAITVDIDPNGITTKAYREQRPRYYF